jgi:hypothetical protein
VHYQFDFLPALNCLAGPALRPRRVEPVAGHLPAKVSQHNEMCLTSLEFSRVWRRNDLKIFEAGSCNCHVSENFSALAARLIAVEDVWHSGRET